MRGLGRGRPVGRSPLDRLARRSVRPAPRDPEPEAPRLEATSASPPLRRRAASIFRPRLGLLGPAFALSVVWLVANVRQVSPLDVLPFAWTWLTLWLLFSLGAELWDRYAPSRPPRRRNR